MTATSSTGHIETKEIFIELYYYDHKLFPEILFSINPTEITNGDVAYLIWDVKNAKSIEIDNNIGLVDISGQYGINPTVNTAYKMAVTTFFNTLEYRYVHIIVNDVIIPKNDLKLEK